VAQQFWLSKLLGYDFVIEFKKGRDNKVADALSRQAESRPDQADISIFLISFPTPTWVTDLKSSYQSNQQALDLLNALQTGVASPKGFSLQQGLLLYKGRIWLIKGSTFQQQLLEFIHSNPATGQSEYHRTLHRAKANFFWKGMRTDIKTFVCECRECQENKHETVMPALDFIEGLHFS
jgi:hypothetical protein